MLTGYPHLVSLKKYWRVLHEMLSAKRIPPNNEDLILPDELTNSNDSILAAQQIAKNILNHLKLTNTLVAVSFTKTDVSSPAHVELKGGSEYFIEVSSELADDLRAIASVLTHEVMHIFLFKNKIDLANESENELLVDVAVMFYGLGVMLLNGFKYNQKYGFDYMSCGISKQSESRMYGYLTTDEFGYLLARRSIFADKNYLDYLTNHLAINCYRNGYGKLEQEMRDNILYSPTNSYFKKIIYLTALNKANKLIKKGRIKDQEAFQSYGHTFKCGKPLRIVVECPKCCAAMGIPIKLGQVSVTCKNCGLKRLTKT